MRETCPEIQRRDHRVGRGVTSVLRSDARSTEARDSRKSPARIDTCSPLLEAVSYTHLTLPTICSV
eukprot:3583666-Rhodomonas_salina.1